MEQILNSENEQLALKVKKMCGFCVLSPHISKKMTEFHLYGVPSHCPFVSMWEKNSQSNIFYHRFHQSCSCS